MRDAWLVFSNRHQTSEELRKPKDPWRVQSFRARKEGKTVGTHWRWREHAVRVARCMQIVGGSAAAAATQQRFYLTVREEERTARGNLIRTVLYCECQTYFPVKLMSRGGPLHRCTPHMRT